MLNYIVTGSRKNKVWYLFTKHRWVKNEACIDVIKIAQETAYEYLNDYNQLVKANDDALNSFITDTVAAISNLKVQFESFWSRPSKKKDSGGSGLAELMKISKEIEIETKELDREAQIERNNRMLLRQYNGAKSRSASFESKNEILKTFFAK